MTKQLDRSALADFVARALAEDIGRGDITTAVTMQAGRANSYARGRLEYRAPGVICGLPVVEAVFTHLDPGAKVTLLYPEGTELAQPQVVAYIDTTVVALLSGERVMLNVLARLSGTATLTRKYVQAVASTGAKAQVLDTRKTTPLLRSLEKYAVRVGGGKNHRIGLDDGILIKDNHIALAGGIGNAVRLARAQAAPGIKVEVEVEDLRGLEEALSAGAEMILLDNMPLEMMREAVILNAGRVPLEASGGVNLGTVAGIARTGVDFISAGALTHSAPMIDVALEVEL